MASTAANPLLSTTTSDSSLTVQLHPLVLLTISDYVTRHSLRNQQGPIVGAVIGQQNGREVTMEHAFECKLAAKEGPDGSELVVMDNDWFAERLEQFKDVHKSPALDLVALFTLGPASGPLPQHVPVLQQLQHHYNDSLMLLLFHPETILDGSLTGGKLPISLYESFYEPGSENADKGLQVDKWAMGRQLQMRFRELGYEVETGEAEMIGVDFVAKGSGNATAVATMGTAQKTATDAGSSKKGKAKADDSQPNGTSQEVPLSPEDEELVNSLTAKSNAIKMLHQRISLIKSYLNTLPPSYLTGASTDPSDAADQTNHVLLRSISSMLSRLPLLAPPSSTVNNSSSPSGPTIPSSLATASAQEQSDVHLVSLLALLTRSISEAKDLGSKYAVVQKARTEKSSPGGIGMGTGRGGPRAGGVGGDPWGMPGEVPEFGMGGMA
ncbi:hypothetical protein MBLNU459_g7451t1 [Dothideomycetes sp. NU459]